MPKPCSDCGNPHMLTRCICCAKLLCSTCADNERKCRHCAFKQFIYLKLTEQNIDYEPAVAASTHALTVVDWSKQAAQIRTTQN